MNQSTRINRRDLIHNLPDTILIDQLQASETTEVVAARAGGVRDQPFRKVSSPNQTGARLPAAFRPGVGSVLAFGRAFVEALGQWVLVPTSDGAL